MFKAFLLLASTLFCSYASAASHFPSQGVKDLLISMRRSVVKDTLPTTLNIVQANSSFTLAVERTYRKDPLENFKYYTGGWNISNSHYWASVGFTAIPFFLIGIIWLVAFGFVSLLMCCYFCCCRRRYCSYSRTSYALSLILLMIFTCAAIIGCIVLYLGQAKAHESTRNTLDYVASQANLTVENLRNFSTTLAVAKNVGVNQVFLPADVQARIDTIQRKINGSTDDLVTRVDKNTDKIQNVLDYVRLDLIIIAAVMLLLAFLGFFFSVLGLQLLVYMLVPVGWFLVAGTFILCGIFLLLHNVAADTCVAMDEWVKHPHQYTALDDILPCVDIATANASLYQSKEATFELVKVINQVINNVSNINYPPLLATHYFNQSGPLMPILCNPFKADMTERECEAGELDFSKSSQVWKNYVCNISSAGICTTVGRVIPDVYSQMTAAVTVNYGLYLYSPFLVQLEDCTFVRDTFATISKGDCPGLQKYTRWIYIGLVMVSAAVMLSLIFWVIYARERRHRKYSKHFTRSQPL